MFVVSDAVAVTNEFVEVLTEVSMITMLLLIR
jgi:hypothetical protein